MSRSVTVIAEAGLNHGGQLNTAMAMAESAKKAGADIVKYQTYKTEKLIRPWTADYELLQKLELSPPEWIMLANYCCDIGIEFMTTPGDLDSLKFAVEELGVKRIKIGSDDLTYRPLVEAAHKTGLPLILSTGMATVAEITDTVFHIDNFSLMHCVSQYPCPPYVVNLRSIEFLQNTFACPVGYSDHTADPRVVVGAVFAGAELIEMHFKRTPWEKTIDDAVSFSFKQMREVIDDIREAELLLGEYGKYMAPGEEEMALKVRKSTDGLRGVA